MKREDFKMIRNDNPIRGYTIEEESLILDYQYGLRDLSEFELRKGKQLSDRLTDLYEYMETTRLY